MSTRRAKQLQAQGERTRARLLEVARPAFAENSAITLSAIAKAADVGIGTLYRHFPTREDLVFELYRHDVDQLAASADELLAHAEPFTALRNWLDCYARFVMAKAGLVQALRPKAIHPQFAREAYGPVAGAISRLIAANQAISSIRPGITPDDLLLALDGLYNLDPDSDWEPRAATLFDLITTGLRHPS